jgi:hypothetical protein
MVPAKAFQFNREANDDMAATLYQLGHKNQAGVPLSSFDAKLSIPHVERFSSLFDFEQVYRLDQITELGITVIAGIE